jgi:hypothetical protein
LCCLAGFKPNLIAVGHALSDFFDRRIGVEFNPMPVRHIGALAFSIEMQQADVAGIAGASIL